MRVFAVFSSFLLMVSAVYAVYAETPPEGEIPEDTSSRVDKLDTSMRVILAEGIKRHGIRPEKHHCFLKKPSLRKEFAKAIDAASQAYPAVSPYLLVAISFREGSFNNGSLGKISERTTFQIAPYTMRVAKRLDLRCDHKTIGGSALCAAVLLDYWLKRCGTESGAVLAYATGYTCKPKKNKHKWIMRDRVGLAKSLMEVTE